MPTGNAGSISATGTIKTGNAGSISATGTILHTLSVLGVRIYLCHTISKVRQRETGNMEDHYYGSTCGASATIPASNLVRFSISAWVTHNSLFFTSLSRIGATTTIKAIPTTMANDSRHGRSSNNGASRLQHHLQPCDGARPDD